MLTIIQSNKIEVLFNELLTLYKANADTHSVFDPFNVIVPSKVMGEWLKKQVADQAGISTLVTTEFWGRYFVGLMQRVLRSYKRFREDVLEVPEVAMLSKSIMQWQIFGFIMANQTTICQNTQHPLYPFIAPLVQDMAEHQPTVAQSASSPTWLTLDRMLINTAQDQTAQHHSLEERLWQLANDMASMLNRYMTYRPDWLTAWGDNQPIAVAEMIADKDALQNRLHGRAENDIVTPDWLIEHYLQLEIAQRYLWRILFDADYRYREQLHQQFWQAFAEKDSHIANRIRRQLPKQLILFTIQQLPPSELLDLQRLGELTQVYLLHFNPSEQFWADIVDKNWLLEQQLDNPNSIYLKDYGHTLLSRFGKQSREVFAMLANLSGNAYKTVRWEDKFVDNPHPNSLLAHLQQDILMLEESQETRQKIGELVELTHQSIPQSDKPIFDPSVINTLTGLDNTTHNDAMKDLLAKIKQEHEQQQNHARHWQSKQLLDTSLAIQVCHSTTRQLEVLRNMLIGWLNETDLANPNPIVSKRGLSDILVLLPDIDAQQNVIEAIFPKGVGADGYHLPAKVTGVIGKDINQLWQAITGYYRLLNRTGARFSRVEVFDWLMLPPLYQSFGLNLEQMTRACELLSLAGFIRGFDETHLQQTLDEHDDDYRYTFAYALERLVAGVMMPHAEAVSFGTLVNRYGEIERTQPLLQVSMNDVGIVSVLCEIYQVLHDNRYVGKHSQTVEAWLTHIETLIQQRFSLFNQTNAWLAIFSAQNELKKTLDAHQKKSDNELSQAVKTKQLPLKLNFVLESIAQQLVSQQVSAEPSGVITFARMGAVRNLPYKLVVMLNLNLSDFPKREPQNRYNLMQAGLPKRGDRFREDDDLGAFLDGLLCAREACWLFYNGKSTTDTHEHLPASPVQELLSFLQTEVQWQASDQFVANPVTENDRDDKMPTPVPQIEQYLVTHHPALPFDKSYFELQQTSLDNEATTVLPTASAKTKKTSAKKNTHQKTPKPSPDDTQQAIAFVEDTVPLDQLSYANRLAKLRNQLYPPAQIWYGLYQQLHHNLPHPTLERITLLVPSQLNQWLDIWQTKQQAVNPHIFEASQHQPMMGETLHTHVSMLIKAVQHPANTFINAQQLYVQQVGEAMSELESLTTDSLSNFYLSQQLTQQLLERIDTKEPNDTPAIHKIISQSFLYNDTLPAGVNRYQTLEMTWQQAGQRLETLFDKLVGFEAEEAEIGKEAQQAIMNQLRQAMSECHPLTDKNTHDITRQQKQALLAKLITPCRENFVAISVPLDWQANPFDKNSLSDIGDIDVSADTMPMTTWVLTAELPLTTTTNDGSANVSPKFWLRLLPHSGSEKYQLQCWLSHLCWQVARRTTDRQVADNDGFSLWQYKKQGYYLPAIAWQQAYAYLQDWLMVWQLTQQQVIILPPKIAIEYLTPAKHNPDTPSQDLKTWQTPPYNAEPLEHNFYHATWQLLLSDKRPTVIEPFIQTLGAYVYLPLMATMKYI